MAATSSETQGQSVRSEEKVRQKFSSKGTKKCFLLLCPVGEHVRRALFVCSYTTAIVSIKACLAQRNARRKFDIKSPSEFKKLSARKLKTLFQKIQGIHACIGHVLRRYIYRDFLKDTTTETSHGKVTSYFFQSLS